MTGPLMLKNPCSPKTPFRPICLQEVSTLSAALMH